jgi:hypothetical protein
MSGKGFWDDYNKEQKRIMEEQERANAGKKHKKPDGPLIGKRTPSSSPKKQATRKK